MTGDGGRTDGAWRPPAPAPVASTGPENIPGYVDLTVVGRGGDSIVYRARQVTLNRDVAIKVLGVDDEARTARFAREVEITVDLGRQHPNIVNVLDIGTTDDGRSYLVMDFVEAGTVHDRLKAHGPLPVHEVVEIGYVLADALAFAHGRDVLHRDVKPQNILVLPTSWVLADFGIARLAGSEHTASVETFTYRHAAPQILDGMKPSAGDDLWSLGSTLYTLLDGRPPFASDDPDEDSALAYIRRARTEPHRPLTVEGAEGVAAVIDRCLAKSVDDRWPSAGELRDAFAALRSTAWLPGTAAPARAVTPSPAAAASADLSPTPTAPRTAPAEQPPAEEPSVTAPEPISPAPVSPAPVSSAPFSPAPTDEKPPVAAQPPVAPAPVEGGWAPSADPEPVALSVLSHAPVAVEPDAAPTGTGPVPGSRPQPADDGGARGGETPPPAPPDEKRPRSRRTRVLVGLAVLALVVGIGLSAVGSALRGGDDEDAAAGETPTADVIPTEDTTPFDPEALEAPPDPELAVFFQRLDQVGLDVEMEWVDPSEGEGSFIIAKTSGPGGGIVSYEAYVDPGVTSHVISGALATGGRYCYAIILTLATGEFGVSDVRCLNVPER